MRLTALKESAPGQKGITTKSDALNWIARCESGDASDTDMQLYGAIKVLYNEVITISKQLGGKSTVFEVLSAMK